MKLSSTAILLAIILVDQCLDAQARVSAAERRKTQEIKTRKKNKQKNKKKKNGSTTSYGLGLMSGSFPAGTVMGSIMRGFQQQKVNIDGAERPSMEKFAYTSGSSGGNFPNMIFAYATNTTSDEILDANGISDPSKLTKEYLENTPQTSMFSAFDSPLILSLALAYFESFLTGVPFWSNFNRYQFLKPFGISDEPPSTTRDDVKATPIFLTSIFSPLETYPASLFIIGKLLQQNLNKSIDMLTEFYDNSTNMVFMPAGSDIVWDLIRESQFQYPLPVLMTADEIIIPAKKLNMTYGIVGNITSDPFLFEPMFAPPDEMQPDSEGPFTMSKMLAAGTALLPIFRAGGQYPEELMKALDSPLVLDVPTTSGDKRSMVLADGGYNDGTGIPALVQKKVKKIVSVLYTTSRFNDPSQWFKGYIMASFFGAWSANLRHAPTDYMFTNNFCNHMFNLNSNGENQLLKLENNLQSLYEAGEPMITTLHNLEVIDNPFWGIEGGWTLDLTLIVVSAVPQKFAEQVPYDVVAPPEEGMNITDEFGYFTNEELKNVPNMKSQNGNMVIDIPGINGTYDLPLPDFALSTKEVRMTNVLCSWMIERAWNGLTGADGESKFEGFAKFFED